MRARPGWPLGRGWLLGLTGAVAALTLAANVPGQQAYPLWVESSAAVRETLAVNALPITLSAALLGHLLARPGTLLHAAASGRRGPQLARHGAALWMAAVLGIAMGLAPRWWWTADRATWGAPCVADVLIAAVGLAALIVVSFVIGAMTMRPVWSVAVGIGVAVWVLLPDVADRALSVVSPAWHWAASPRFSPNPIVAAYFVLFSALVTTVALLWHTREVSRGSRALTACGVAAVLVMVAFPFSWRPHLYTYRAEIVPRCEDVRNVRICVHPANELAIAAIAEQINAVNEKLGTRLVDGFLDQAAADVIVGEPGRVLSNVYPVDLAEPVLSALLGQASGLAQCHGTADPADESVELAYAVSARLTATVEGRDTVAVAATEFDAWSDEQFRQLLNDHRNELWRCQLTRAELGR